MSLFVFMGASYYVSQPVIQPTRSSIDCRMRAINTDAFLGQLQERTLLRVSQGESFQGPEDDRICGSIRRQNHKCLVSDEEYLRYVMIIESFLAIASSATAFVKSTVRRTDFCRLGRWGASRRTISCQNQFL
jgi:hypothetical protein